MKSVSGMSDADRLQVDERPEIYLRPVPKALPDGGHPVQKRDLNAWKAVFLLLLPSFWWQTVVFWFSLQGFSVPRNSEGDHCLLLLHNSPWPLKYQITVCAGLSVIIILFPNRYKGRTKEDCLKKKNNLLYVVVYKALAHHAGVNGAEKHLRSWWLPTSVVSESLL